VIDVVLYLFFNHTAVVGGNVSKAKEVFLSSFKIMTKLMKKIC
jgi:hypothetical protein